VKLSRVSDQPASEALQCNLTNKLVQLSVLPDQPDDETLLHHLTKQLVELFSATGQLLKASSATDQFNLCLSFYAWSLTAYLMVRLFFAARTLRNLM
jgi:hypothetical protein